MKKQKYVFLSPKTGEEYKRFHGPLKGKGIWIEEDIKGRKIAFPVDDRTFIKRHSFEIIWGLIVFVLSVLASILISIYI